MFIVENIELCPYAIPHTNETKLSISLVTQMNFINLLFSEKTHL